jgi:hypothetical protein
MTVQTIRMVRDPACNPAPHSADVHPEMVDMWRTAGYVLPDEARFEIVDAQPELQLEGEREPHTDAAPIPPNPFETA